MKETDKQFKLRIIAELQKAMFENNEKEIRDLDNAIHHNATMLFDFEGPKRDFFSILGGGTTLLLNGNIAEANDRIAAAFTKALGC